MINDNFGKYFYINIIVLLNFLIELPFNIKTLTLSINPY